MPTTAGSASSSTALRASAPGPTPREDSSLTSRERRSAQYEPAAPTSSRARIEPPSAIGSTGPRSPSRVSSVRSTKPGIRPVPELRSASPCGTGRPAVAYAAACWSAIFRPSVSVMSVVFAGDTQSSALVPK